MSTIEQKFREMDRRSKGENAIPTEGVTEKKKEEASGHKPLTEEEFLNRLNEPREKGCSTKEKNRVVKAALKPGASEVVRSLLRLDRLERITLSNECKRRFNNFAANGPQGNVYLPFEIILAEGLDEKSFMEELGDAGKEIKVISSSTL